MTDMVELVGFENGSDVATDQVLYSLTRRGIEFDLLPWCDQHHMPIMAYSPIEQGRLLRVPVVRSLATRHHATSTQIALAWVLRRDGIIAIPQAGVPERVHENRGALDVIFSGRRLS